MPNVTYYSPVELAVDTTYFWRIRANDSTGYSDFSAVTNFTVSSYLALVFLTDTVSFGDMAPGDVANTTDNVPLPFWVENTGNINANISVNGSQYFTSVSLNTSYYQFKIRENEAGSFNTTLSRTNWTNMSKDKIPPAQIAYLNWRSAFDDFLMDLNLTVPTDESPGVKSSLITYTVEG